MGPLPGTGGLRRAITPTMGGPRGQLPLRRAQHGWTPGPQGQPLEGGVGAKGGCRWALGVGRWALGVGRWALGDISRMTSCWGRPLGPPRRALHLRRRPWGSRAAEKFGGNHGSRPARAARAPAAAAAPGGKGPCAAEMFGGNWPCPRLRRAPRSGRKISAYVTQRPTPNAARGPRGALPTAQRPPPPPGASGRCHGLGQAALGRVAAPRPRGGQV